MAKMNSIPEGQPLTYEFFNLMLEKLNKIKDQPEDSSQEIDVTTPGVKNPDDQVVKITSGKYSFDIQGKDITTNVEVPFDKGGNFNSDNVIVVASIVDRFFGDKGGGAQMSNVTLTRVSNTGFNARIQILKSVKQKVTLELHYIAIGSGPKRSG